MSQLNADIVPHDLSQAVDIIVAGMDDEDRESFRTESLAPIHHTTGRFLRNTWSLWDKESILVQWFRTNLKIGHADDISGLILSAVQARVLGIEFDPSLRITSIHAHWARYNCNQFGEKETPDDDVPVR